MGKRIKGKSTKIPSVEEIQLSLVDYFKNCFCIDNYFLFRKDNGLYAFNRYEADFVALRESGYAVEVEIKRTVEDVKKGFRKISQP